MAEEFAIRLQRETGCQIIDREHGRIVEAGPLEGCCSIGRGEHFTRTGAGRVFALATTAYILVPFHSKSATCSSFTEMITGGIVTKCR